MLIIVGINDESIGHYIVQGTLYSDTYLYYMGHAVAVQCVYIDTLKYHATMDYPVPRASGMMQYMYVEYM